MRGDHPPGPLPLPVVAAALAFVGLPMAERVREDLQAIRGFLRRRDPRAQTIASEREALLTAFPELRAWVSQVAGA